MAAAISAAVRQSFAELPASERAQPNESPYHMVDGGGSGGSGGGSGSEVSRSLIFPVSFSYAAPVSSVLSDQCSVNGGQVLRCSARNCLVLVY